MGLSARDRSEEFRKEVKQRLLEVGEEAKRYDLGKVYMSGLKAMIGKLKNADLTIRLRTLRDFANYFESQIEDLKNNKAVSGELALSGEEASRAFIDKIITTSEEEEKKRATRPSGNYKGSDSEEEEDDLEEF